MDVQTVSNRDNMRLLCAPELAQGPLELLAVSSCHKRSDREVLCPHLDVADRSHLPDVFQHPVVVTGDQKINQCWIPAQILAY